MGVVIAIDAGTTGVRSVAIDESGQPQASAYEEIRQIFPRPGWVEHDPAEIWARVRSTLSQVCTQLAETSQAIAAIGITNQRETTVAWDRRTGQARHNAIVWQDRRTASRCEALAEAGYLDLVRSLTGLVLDPYFSATKLEWLLTEGGVSIDDNLAFGTIDTWVAWNLTGGPVGGAHVTDASNASRTMLFDIEALRWSEELCDVFALPPGILPEVVPTSARIGTTSTELTPIPAGLPVSALVGDQAGALFGQACFEPGMTKNTYGTGSFILMNVGPTLPEPADGLLTSVAWDLSRSSGNPGKGSTGLAYALEGSVFATGAAVQWLRDGLGIIESAPDVTDLASSIDSNGGVFLVPAFSGLGSPWWDPWARGAIVGLTVGTGRAHLARAALESMAYQTRDVVDCMMAASGQPIRDLRADGGASLSDLLLQFQADQLQVTVSRPLVSETTALGAAFLAGLAEGVWASTSEIASLWSLDAEFKPQAPTQMADSLHQAWLRAVSAARGWARPTISPARS
ncbi:MAG: glycerol kinase GlpK [Acidimicrobiales bacterium]